MPLWCLRQCTPRLDPSQGVFSHFFSKHWSAAFQLEKRGREGTWPALSCLAEPGFQGGALFQPAALALAALAAGTPGAPPSFNRTS